MSGTKAEDTEITEGLYQHEKGSAKREEIMSKSSDELRPEYDLKSLGKGIRGKYYKQYQEETNVVLIDPDLSKAFPNTQSVNDALREVLDNRKHSAT